MGCRIAACLVLCAAWVAAADGLTPGERILGEAVAVLRISQPHWLDKEAARFAAALGQDPAPLRSAMARGLFRCRSLDGLDLSRPALIAWRPGPAPLVAILPITNRRAFLEQFGAGDDAPFIRVGEREGTVVYSQNGADGLYEYRLMVGENNVACLARTATECRALAALTLSRATTDAPLAFSAKGGWVTGLTGGAKGADLSGMPAGVPIAPILGLWTSLVSQVTETGIELRPDGEDGMALTFRLKAVPDSLLAVWISNQRNHPNRLLPLVRTPATFLSVAGQVAWQGQGESFGSAIAGLIKHQAGKAWTETVDEAWTALWSLSDRNGPFAAACDLQLPAAKAGGDQVSAIPLERLKEVGIEWRSLVEQRRAIEVVNHTNTVTTALSGTPGEALNVVGAQGFRWTPAQGMAMAMAMVATDRHVVQVQGTLRPVDQAIAELVQKSQGNAVPDARTAIVMASFDATPLARGAAQFMGRSSDAVVQTAIINTALTVAGPGELAVEVGLPHMRVASMVRDSGLLAPAEPTPAKR